MPRCNFLVPSSRGNRWALVDTALYLCRLRMTYGSAATLRRYLELWSLFELFKLEDMHPPFDERFHDQIRFLKRAEAIDRTTGNRLLRIHAEASDFVHGRREDCDRLRLLIELTHALTHTPSELS